ncbi:MAG: hypothetical protein Q9210_001328, partial [Variospora velana]
MSSLVLCPAQQTTPLSSPHNFRLPARLHARPRVKDISLQDKDDIKHHRHIAQAKLDRVPRYPAPVTLQQGIDDELRDAEDGAHEIQDDLFDAPPDGGFPLVVGSHLRDVLDHRDEELDVRDRVHDVEPCPTFRSVAVVTPSRTATRCDEDGERNDGGDATHGNRPYHGPDPFPRAAPLLEAPDAPREHAPAEGTERHGVDREDDIVGAHRWERGGRVPRGVLGADEWGGVEGKGGGEVGDEAEGVDEGERGGSAGGGAP